LKRFNAGGICPEAARGRDLATKGNAKKQWD
jgi:hypothetical protein